MPACPVCSTRLTDGAPYCPNCGAAPSDRTTVAALDDPGRPVLTNPAQADSRFVAGTVLADRYRIVTLLGRGGMGEVYKADDLKLHQVVALKFLPEGLGLRGAALARFHAEARIARQVSHPNVCRVYDVGEVDGLHFITMEFIDGEDLASLLRRIGRLPADKAVEVARQLCAGIAAAHDAGVLHRDLKPANVMLDGRGRIRITDFGVAAVAREVREPGVLAGTPAYMAPEQLTGQDASIRSDIYALGLVLYELFTGRPVIDATSIGEALLHHASQPATPSHRVPDLDPVVEHAILRCLQPEPAARPASAIEVSAALPGGDPLQAALAAGETPSPEMVASAGRSGVMRPALAVTIAALSLAALAGATFLRTRMTLEGRLPLPPEVLAHEARRLIAGFGYPDPPVDTAYGFEYHMAYLRYDRLMRRRANRWPELSRPFPAVIHFWYRESPEPLVATVAPRQVRPPGLGPVSLTNPPATVRGMRHVVIDPHGRLTSFEALPSEVGTAPNAAGTPDWDRILSAAGLEGHALEQADPGWIPPMPFDARAAWVGTYPGRQDLSLRIEAAAFRGRLVAFRQFSPWNPLESRPDARQPPPFSPVLTGVVVSIVLLAGAWMAWKNVRAGRSDRRTAFRLALLTSVAQMLIWLLEVDHVAGPGELLLYRLGLSEAALNAISVYLLYLALEPYVRRSWPQVLVAWTRAFGGRATDPLVGREVLWGVALGAGFAATSAAGNWLVSGVSTSAELDGALSARRLAALFISTFNNEIFLALIVCLLLVVVRLLLRSSLIANGVLMLVFSVIGWGGPQIQSTAGAISGLLLATVTIVALTRFGLVAAVASLATAYLIIEAPLSLNPSNWFFSTSLFVLGTIGALAAVGGYLAASGRRTRVAV